MGDCKESEDEKETMIKLGILVTIFIASTLALAIWGGFFNCDRFHGTDELYTIESAAELWVKVEDAARAIPESKVVSFDVKQKGDKFKVDYWVRVPVGVKFPYGELAGHKMRVFQVIWNVCLFLYAAFTLIGSIRMSRQKVKSLLTIPLLPNGIVGLSKAPGPTKSNYNAVVKVGDNTVFATYRCGVPNSRGVSPHRGCSC